MKSTLIKGMAAVIILLFACSLSTVVNAGSIKDWGNHGKNWKNHGKDWGNYGKKWEKYGKNWGNHGKNWENYGKNYGEHKHRPGNNGDNAPIPSSILLLASGLGGVALFRKKVKK